MYNRFICKPLTVLLLLGFVILLISSNNLLYCSQPMRPAELDTLNYTHVLFHWNFEVEADAYHLQIADYEIYDPFETAVIAEYDLTTNAIVVKDVFDWGRTYLWRYWWLDEDGNEKISGGLTDTDVDKTKVNWEAYMHALEDIDLAIAFFKEFCPCVCAGGIGAP